MVLERRAIFFPEVISDDSIPAAVKIGDMLFCSSVAGVDPVTAAPGEGVERQLELAFRNLEALVERAGMTSADIGHVTVFTNDSGARKWINKPWCDMFREEGNRPARKTTTYPLPDGVLVQLQAVAVDGHRRESLEVPGLAHRDPIPMGTKIGGRVFSSVIGGQDPATSERVDGMEAQTHHAMNNMKLLVEQAGGTVDDVGVVWVYLRDRADQPPMIKAWLEMFPEDGNRPARKTIIYGDLKRRETLLQLQFTASLGGKRQNFEIPGVTHRDPIPMGARVGRMVFSSGIGGYDPRTGEQAEDVERQSELAFGNLRTLTEQAGSSLDSVGQLTILLRDYGSRPTVLRWLHETFPEPDRRPACHFMALGLPGRNLVQVHATGVSA